MTWRDKLEIGLKENAPYRKDNLPRREVIGTELPQGPGRSAEIPHARGTSTTTPSTAAAAQRKSPPSDREPKAETHRKESGEQAARRSAFDTTHDSSPRGEHRYPDRHQTEAEQKARHDRDALKRKLGGRR
jgi:hypothetical protein